jgi:hypothetical protein
MIRVQLQEFESWDVTTLTLKGNLVSRLQAQRGVIKRGYTCITAGGETLDNWSRGNHRSPV